MTDPGAGDAADAPIDPVSDAGPAPDPAPGVATDPTADRRSAATRLEEGVGRISVLARRLARPIGIAGRIGLVAGIAVWLLLPAPVWPDRPPWWSSLVSLLVLAAPGAWLMFHRWWLDRVFVRAAELAPAATATAVSTYEKVRSGRGPRGEGGRVRRAWRFYRETLSPLQGHVSDALGITVPLRPLALITSGVALLLTLILLVCVPIAFVGRIVLLVT